MRICGFVKKKQFKKAWNIAYGYAYERGMGDESQDFAQYVLMMCLKGRDIRTYQYFADYQRFYNGRSTNLSHINRSYFVSDMYDFIGDWPKEIDAAMNSRAVDQIISQIQNEMAREICELYFKRGMLMVEIGKKLGVTESRISQIIAEELLDLKEQYSR